MFAAGAVIVWVAGSRLSGYADAIATRTSFERVFLGALLLGGVTSLPELVTSVTAAAIGNAALLVNNLLGGIAVQVAVLAVADLAVLGRALSSLVTRPSVLLRASAGIVVISVVALGIAVDDTGSPAGPGDRRRHPAARHFERACRRTARGRLPRRNEAEGRHVSGAGCIDRPRGILPELRHDGYWTRTGGPDIVVHVRRQRDDGRVLQPARDPASTLRWREVVVLSAGRRCRRRITG